VKQTTDIYSPLNPCAQFRIQRRQREIRRIFARTYPAGLPEIKLLEIGCGNGQWLTEFQTFGFRVNNLAGIELDEQRAATARERIIGADIRQGNAMALPWEDNSFDIICSFGSRVCRSDGFILWYDFSYDNPQNPDVRGIGKQETCKLFAPWHCNFRKVTLAPPIARRVVPVSWSLAEDLETFCPFLRTHLIAQITPPQQNNS